MKKNKIIAIFLSMIILLTIFMSYQLIIYEADHDCTGNNCPVCQEIEQAINFINEVKVIPLATLAMIVFEICRNLCKLSIDSRNFSNTLVSLKVELLN